MKTCNKCGESKPVGDFSKDKSTRDGLMRICRLCNRAKVRAWNEAHPGRNLERSAEWRAANPDRVKDNSRSYYAANRDRLISQSVEYNRNSPTRKDVQRRYAMAHKDQIRERMQRYHRDNRAQANERLRRWKAANREKVAADNHARRSYRYSPDSVEYIAVLHRDPCAYCGARCEQIDHIVPLSRGGENHWSNITASCGRCNSAKNARPLLSFLHAG